MMGDWTTFMINIPATPEEVARIESSPLWTTTFSRSPLHDMAATLGAREWYGLGGDSQTDLEYLDGKITGKITFKNGTAAKAYAFMEKLELVLLRQIEEVHLAAFYDGWGPEREIVHWRCQCDLPCEDLDYWEDALIGVRLRNPNMSEKAMRTLAHNLTIYDRKCEVIEKTLVLSFSNFNVPSAQGDARRFGLAKWDVESSGSLIYKTPIGWTSSDFAASQLIGQVLNR